MSVEQEIVDTVGFEPRREYKDRQDYLAALARSVDQAEDSDFDNLSKEAVDWFNAAVRAINKKEELPDFEGTEEAEEPADEEAEETSEEPSVEETPKPKSRAKAKTEPAPEPETAPTRRRKGQAPVKLDHPPIILPNSPDDVQLDSFGVVKGSKNAAAVALLEKGCRMADISESIGGTYYNLVQRLVKQGHKLEKGANGLLKITHKDDVKPKKK